MMENKSLSRNKPTFLNIVIILLLLLTLIPAWVNSAAACKAGEKEKAKVVLVHGFRSGAHAWWKVVFALEKMGYTSVTALDLKASGQDPAHISEVHTLEQYTEPLERYMAALGPGERAVVVAHSAGGVSLTNILHRHSHKVAVAVYVAATMLKFNYVTCQDLNIGVPYFSESKCSASCPKLPHPCCFDKVIPADTFPTDNDETQDMRLERMLARPGPYRAIVTSRINDQEARADIDMVPRVYVKTRLDRTLLPEKQDAMVELWPPSHVIDVNSDHDLPYTNPQLLAAFIANASSFYS